MVDGLVLEQKISHLAGGVSSVEKAKIGLIQFCLSAPKTDVCSCISDFMYAVRTYFLINLWRKNAYALRAYFYNPARIT